MKNLLKKTMTGLLLVPAMALMMSAVMPMVVPSTPAYAATCNNKINIKNGARCAQGDNTSDKLDGDQGIFKLVTNVLLFIIGAISVIMLIIGGIRYTISGGDSSAVTAAKNTILYAIVGIVVALFAYAIVNFVLDNFATK